MSDARLHPLARDYLARLRRAGRHLEPDRLCDLIAEIEAHLAQTISPGASDHDALHALERLGPVGDIVEAESPAAERAGRDADPRGWREWAAVILLPLGGFAFGVGWLLGLILLWSSRLWTTREKVLGSLIVPGGLASAFIVLLFVGGGTTTQSCSGRAAAIDPVTGAVIRRATAMRCTTSGGLTAVTIAVDVVLAVFFIGGPIITAIHLARRARRNQTLLAVGGR